jgi:predicted dinucleotide-binding enzyme
MATSGFIGSGNIGGSLARLAVDAGYDVVVSNSRGPETLTELVASLGPQARAATSAQAGAAGDIVVVTVPLGRIDQVPAEPLTDKVVIDTCNYYPQLPPARRHYRRARRPPDHHQRARPAAPVEVARGEGVQQHLLPAPGLMQRPAGAADRNTLMIAGDDAAAKQTVTGFIDAIGYDVFDTGSLDSWRFQRDQPAYAGAHAEGGDFDKPDLDELQALLEQADPSIR